MLLLGAPLVYMLGGLGGLWIKWHDESSLVPMPMPTGNSTIDEAGRVLTVLRMLYTTGHTPEAFQTGGSVALIVYVLVCIVYVIVRFNTIARECGRDVDRAAASDDYDDPSKYQPLALYAPPVAPPAPSAPDGRK